MARKNGTAGDDVLSGTTVADTINGLAGNDVLAGLGGNDTIDGGDGLDILFGDGNGNDDAGVTPGNDSLSGGTGDDLLSGGDGDDTLDGGDGDDILVGGQVSFATFDTLSGTFVYSSDFRARGRDTYRGGAGTDEVHLGQYDGVLAVDNSDATHANAVTEDGEVVATLQGVESLYSYGGDGDDSMIGGTGHDLFEGGGGNDRLVGGAGDDLLSGGAGDDVLDGGTGDDVVNYDVDDRGVLTIDLRIQGQQDTGTAGHDTLTGIEQLFVSSDGVVTLTAADTAGTFFVANTGAMTLTGGAAADTLSGSHTTGAAGAVTLSGAGGNDFLSYFTSVAGKVTLDGGDGDDLISARGPATATILAGAGRDTVAIDLVEGVATTVTLGADADRVTLGYGGIPAAGSVVITDFQTGDAGDTVDLSTYVSGGSLINFFYGSNPFTDGHLRLVKVGRNTELQVDRDAAGTAYDFHTLLTFRNTAPDHLTAANFAGFSPLPGVVMAGDDGANRLTGTAQDDTLTGNGGNDALTGLGGRDVLYGDYAGNDSGQYGGNDVLDGGTGDDLLAGGRGNDRLAGGAGDDLLFTGNVAYAVLSSTETSFSFDTFNDGGNDTLDGGDGFDHAYVVATRAGATIDIGDPGAVSDILVGGVAAGSITGVEAIDFYGGAGDDEVTGGADRDYLQAGEGHNVLHGGAGDDQMTGGIGADTFDGGDGKDSIRYSGLGESLVVDLTRQGTPQNTIGGGRDTLIGIENVTAFDSVGGDLSLMGDGAANTLSTSSYIFGGDLGDVTLVGNGGDDRLNVGISADTTTAASVVLDGGTGSDTLYFYAGNRYLDTVTVRAGTDADIVSLRAFGKATIDAGGGVDRVSIDTLGGTAKVTLGNGADTLSLMGTGGGFRAAAAITVTDFSTGAGGDVLDLAAWLGGGALTNYVPGTNPFADGHLTLVRSGSATLLQVDRDGGDAYATLITFQNTKLASFTAVNFGGYAPDGSASAPLAAAPVTGPIVVPEDWRFVDPATGLCHVGAADPAASVPPNSAHTVIDAHVFAADAKTSVADFHAFAHLALLAEPGTYLA